MTSSGSNSGPTAGSNAAGGGGKSNVGAIVGGVVGGVVFLTILAVAGWWFKGRKQGGGIQHQTQPWPIDGVTHEKLPSEPFQRPEVPMTSQPARSDVSRQNSLAYII